MTFIPLSRVQGVRRISIQEATKFVELIQAAQEASSIRPCPIPNCIAGELDNPDNMGPKTPKCSVCQGTGMIDLDRVCCCGHAAVLLDEHSGVLYCGRDLCLNALRRNRGTGMGA